MNLFVNRSGKHKIMRLNKTSFLFLVIFIEGYVVLASELLAIRLLVPFVGSGTEIVSIIVSAVLLPLAIGYHMGGTAFKKHYKKRTKSGKSLRSVRRILGRNILIALAVLSFGLSYIFLEWFFLKMVAIGIQNRLLQTAIYCLLFLVGPVYILGQTVPLVSNYFSRRKLSEITGVMLFFSTTGSFFGSVFSTIVLMTYAGVHVTVMLTLALLVVLNLLLARRLASRGSLVCVLLVIVFVGLNGNVVMKAMHIVSDNAYNTVQIGVSRDKQTKTMVLNRSIASRVSKDPNERLHYIAYIEDNFITPLMVESSAPRDILVLGAGGFTLGLYDTNNNYIFVDIDPSLKEVAEAHFLPGELAKNKHFVPASARAFVRSETKKYDLIVIDTYTNMMAIPMETTTQEFLRDTKKLLKENGVVVANILSSPTFSDIFTARYHNTFTSVFPTSTRQIIGTIDPWNHKPPVANAIYSFYNTAHAHEDAIYTDDKNSYSLDR
jgi:spermidine synthase